MTGPELDDPVDRYAPVIAAGLDLDGDRVAALLTAVLERYGEPHRHYHTSAHLTSMLSMSEACDHPSKADPALLFAIFYHDAIYDPRRRDNEAASARLAHRELTTVGVKEAVLTRVEAMILATAGHDHNDDPATG